MHKITYGDLEDALLTLGFTVTSGVGEYGAHYIAFDNPEYDAWIVVPEAAGEELLQPIDLRQAERTVVGRGVAASTRFRKLLAQHEAGMAVRAS